MTPNQPDSSREGIAVTEPNVPASSRVVGNAAWETPPMSDSRPVAALARIVHMACVFVDGEGALRHQPEAHERALAWALERSDPADRALLATTPPTAVEPEPDARDIDRARIREAFLEIASVEIADPDDVCGLLDAAFAASPYLARPRAEA